MPSSFSADFLERIRQSPPPPFVDWRPWQRRLFGWSAILFWLILVGGLGIFLTVMLPLPLCRDRQNKPLIFDCHSTAGVWLCLFALLALWVLYLRFVVLVSQIAYLPKKLDGSDDD
jgi:hypothetical protein